MTTNPTTPISNIEVIPSPASVSLWQDTGDRASGVRVLKSEIPALIEMLAATLTEED